MTIARPLPLRIRPAGAWAGMNLGELWRFRDVLYALALRDLKLRYRQTALGVAWVVIQPLVAAGIMSIVFGLLAGFSGHGIPYFLFAFAGTLAWVAFQTTFSKASLALVSNAQLISRVYFPRVLLPLSAALPAAVDFAVGLAVLVVLLAACGVVPGPGVVLLVVWPVGMSLLAVGAALFTSALAVRYRDVAHVLPVFTQFLFFASPVAYAAASTRGHGPWVAWFFAVNPLTGYLEAFRWSAFGTPVAWGAVVYSVLVTLLLLLAGTAFFGRVEREFADVI